VYQTLLVYREPVNGDYQVALTLQADQQISPITFPDITLNVAELVRKS
jgi:Uma2 family endonuclease